MTTAEESVAQGGVAQPRLLFFTSSRSGHCRRVEGFLAQVLQRRRNHGTFRLHVVDEQARPELARHFNVTEYPTLVVVADRVEQARLERPRGCREIESMLSRWLR
jgi:thioredoxin-like negative regulator of GroEL